MVLTREAITDARRFWEIDRRAYNLALAAVVVVGALVSGQTWADALTWLPALGSVSV